MPYKLNPFTGDLNFYTELGAIVQSSPPSNMCRVTNLYVDPADGNRLTVKYDDVLGGDEHIINSDPPTGKCRVTNLYVNPVDGKMVVDYDDLPVE